MRAEVQPTDGTPSWVFTKASLAESELHYKIRVLEAQAQVDHTMTPRLQSEIKAILALPNHLTDHSFEHLLRICLAHEQLPESRQNWMHAIEPRAAPAYFEKDGDYDFEAIAQENIADARKHLNMVNGIEVAKLPAPKGRGVVTTRDVLKGEMLCVSAPQVVAHSYAAIDDPSELIFSDLSRAELTARLVLRARWDKSVAKKLRKLEFAGRPVFAGSDGDDDDDDDVVDDYAVVDDDDVDLIRLCTEVITRYTWAIDHAPRGEHAPLGRPVRGTHTKVAGHAFTVHGLAGSFNHACCANATMVTFGALQVAFANVAIPKGTEVCVSYGHDALEGVQERRRKLEAHGGFICTCDFCEWQADGSESLEAELARRARERVKKRSHGDMAMSDHDVSKGEAHSYAERLDTLVASYEDRLAAAATAARLPANDSYTPSSLAAMHYLERDFAKTASQDALVREAVRHVWDTLHDAPRLRRHASTSVHQLVLCHAALTKHLDSMSEPGTEYGDGLRHARRQLLARCLQLDVMALATQVERPPDVGLAFGDQFRPVMEAIVRSLKTLQTDHFPVWSFTEETPWLAPHEWRKISEQYTAPF